MAETPPVYNRYNDRGRCYDEVTISDPPTNVRFVYWGHAQHTKVTTTYTGDDAMLSPRSFEYQVYPKLADPEQQIKVAKEAAEMLVRLQVLNQRSGQP